MILLGINYSPEVTGIAPYNTMLAEWLAAHGWDVEVVTTFPYYPAWKKLPLDAGKLYRCDEIEGVTVHRVWHYVPEKVTALRRMVHEASFLISATLRLLSLRRADVLFVVSPPLPLGILGYLYRLIFRRPFVFHVQDLQPDAALGLGMLKPGLLIRLLYQLEGLAYRSARRVSGISPGMIDAFQKKGIAVEKTLLFPNPVDLPRPGDLPAAGYFRSAHGIAADVFLISYSGNLGVKQGLGQILDAAELLQGERDMVFVLCGDGAAANDLKQSVAKRNLASVRILPLQSQHLYRALLVDSDLCLVTQQAGSGAAFLPSKMLNLMAFSRPILATADDASALAQVFRAEQCGLLCQPGDAQAFRDAVLFARSHREEMRGFARKGHDYVAAFRRETVLSSVQSELFEMSQRKKQG